MTYIIQIKHFSLVIIFNLFPGSEGIDTKILFFFRDETSHVMLEKVMKFRGCALERLKGGGRRLCFTKAFRVNHSVVLKVFYKDFNTLTLGQV